MKNLLFPFFLLNTLLCSFAYSQEQAYTPVIEPCDCRFPVDSNFVAMLPPHLKSDSVFQNQIDKSFETLCGYLIVPENRKKAASKKIKLPFIVVKSKNPNKKKDPVLFTGGGPGASSLGWANGITSSTLIRGRDCIAFEQRGTKFAWPYLRTYELDAAIRESYQKNLPKDSMVVEGVKRYKQRLEDRGIDLAGYNTDETVADIHDLLRVLQIDSVNLYGISYSGGLMLAVLQKDPSRIRSLVLDSPLPTFVAIDEDEPVNFREALDVLFERVENDSLLAVKYPHLEERFDDYFMSIVDKTFYFPYQEEGKTDTLQVQYTKNDLLHIIVDHMFSWNPVEKVPLVISEIINGKHEPYIRGRLDRIFTKHPAPDGMRISVYCADQTAYHSEAVIRQLYQLYPYLADFRINDVYKAMCDCWDVPPVQATTKQPFYSNKPVLLGDGAMDPACRPLYMGMIGHYMPNAQRFLFKDRSHVVDGQDFKEMVQKFIDDPYKKLEPNNQNIIAY